MNRRVQVLVLCAALAVAAVACDFEPTTSFDGFDGEASSGVVDTQGATLRGTFQGSGARALRAQRTLAVSVIDDLTVYVFDPDDYDPTNVDLDQAIGSAPIVGGSFTLRGLPEDFIVVFVDSNGDVVGDPAAPMVFHGVRPNQELDIVVDLSDDGEEVLLLDERRTGIDHDDLEFVGRAENIQIESNPMNGSLYVNEYYVESRAGQTSIRKGNRSLTLEDIPEGAQVKVRGILEDETVDGRPLVFAQEIKLQDDEEEEDDDGDKITICHIPPGNPDNARTITISSSAWPAHQAHGDTMGACGS